MCANKRGILPFLVGVAAGVATGFWLNSEEGKGWRKETAERAKAKAADLKEKAGEAVEKVDEYVSEAVDKVKRVASETVSNLKRRYRDKSGESPAQPSTSEAVRNGIKKARERLDDLEADAD